MNKQIRWEIIFLSLSILGAAYLMRPPKFKEIKDSEEGRLFILNTYTGDLYVNFPDISIGDEWLLQRWISNKPNPLRRLRDKSSPE